MKINNFINGTFEPPCSEQYLDNFEPATGEVYSWVANSDSRDIDRAVIAAEKAWESWRRTSTETRAHLLMKVADLIDQNADELASLESQDQGKPLWLARSLDIPRAALNFRFFAREILQHTQTMTQTDNLAVHMTLRKPLGIVGLISPWNLPLYLLTWKLAPALATGNVCIAKPSELTSMTAFKLCELFNEAGLSPGVVNMIFGSGSLAGAALVKHPQVKAISFTGGTSTGRKIMELAAPTCKKLSLEMGGKNANVIFADCSRADAINTTLRSSFLNQGEICLCGSRILVEQTFYEEFIEEFKAKTLELKVGDPKNPDHFIGALVSKEHQAKVQSYITLARREGARFITGDQKIPTTKGYFIPPTIIADVSRESRLFKEEIFGPVVTITPFKNEEEAIALSNDVEYGLSATLWTNHLARAHRMAQALDVGTCWINTWMLRDLRMPFGGMKSSGLGREGGLHSIDFFTETTTLCIKI